MRQRLMIAALAVLVFSLGISLVCLAKAKLRIKQAAMEDAVEDQLDRRVPEVKFDNTPLDAAIDALRDEAHANIVVKWRALEAKGVERKTPVSLRLRDARLSSVLLQVLRDAGGDRDVLLKYEALDGVITLSTGEELERRTVCRLYEISDLLAMSATAERRLAAQGTAGSFPKTYQEHVDELIRLIEDNIDFDSWTNSGGGAIREWSGRLLVKATPEDHRRLASLLQQLRESFQRDEMKSLRVSGQ